MSRGWRWSSLALLLSLGACASNKAAERASAPAGIQDYFVDSDVIVDLRRGDVSRLSTDQLDKLENETTERWIACGAKEAANARYHAATDPSLTIDATVLDFGDPGTAFCGFTPGRSAKSNPVPQVEGAFEQDGLLRALRGSYVVEVRSAQPDLLRERSRSVLREMVALMPEAGEYELPGRAFLPENTLVPGSERIVPTGALPTIEAPAMVADVRCGEEAQAHVVVFTFGDAAAASAALENYQGVSLENFMEVSPFEKSGASGIRVRGEKGVSVLFASGPHLVGLTDAAALEPCDEAVTEIALRAAPIGGEQESATADPAAKGDAPADGESGESAGEAEAGGNP